MTQETNPEPEEILTGEIVEPRVESSGEPHAPNISGYAEIDNKGQGDSNVIEINDTSDQD